MILLHLHYIVWLIVCESMMNLINLLLNKCILLLLIVTDVIHLLCVEKLKNAHMGRLVSCDTTIYQVCIKVFICKYCIYREIYRRNGWMKVVVTFSFKMRFMVMLTRSCSPDTFLPCTLRPISLLSYISPGASHMVYSTTHNQLAEQVIQDNYKPWSFTVVYMF